MRRLLESWDSVAKKIAGRPVMIFLDYDGTLCPIAGKPSRAALPAGARRLLRRLASAPGVAIAVVSGRALRDVKARLGVQGIICAGNHGLEVEGPSLRRTSFAPRGYARTHAAIRNVLAAALRPIKGVLLEDKGLSLSVHYRMASGRDRHTAKTLLYKTLAVPLARGAMRIRSGKMVLEVLPPVDWDKGKTVLWLLARQRPPSGVGHPVPIYIGDDATDEDAFKSVGRGGITACVGNRRRSGARYHLRNPKEVWEFLGRLLAERTRTP